MRQSLRTPTAAFALIATVAAGLLLYLGRNTTFFYDDWWFVTERLDWNADTFLRPHNGHPSMLPILVYKLVFEVAGLDSYWILRLVLTLLVVTCASLLFLYARDRVGDPVALAVAAPFLVFGSAAPDVLWPFQIGFLGSLAAGLGALLALDAKRERLAIGLVCVGLMCSLIGLPLAIVVLVTTRRWTAALPLLGFALWWTFYSGDDGKMENIVAVPGWVWESAEACVRALVGVPSLLAALAVVGIAVAVAIRPDRRTIALVLGVVAFWAMSAVGRAHLGDTGPSEDRYLYPGALLLVLVMIEVLRGRLSQHGRLILVAVFLLAALVNVGRLARNAEHVQGWTLNQRSHFGEGRAFPAGFWPAYRRAQRHYGD